MRLNLSEIENWREFEDLVADYFKDIQKHPENNVTEVLVESSGHGGDGGRDILVTFRVFDSIFVHQKKWVIQCKFYKDSLSKSNLATVNIPSLIHEYGADGYILICKNGVTAKVSEMFENLRRNCKFQYKYLIWTGNQLIGKIMPRAELVEQYFPKYLIFTRNSNKKQGKQ